MEGQGVGSQVIREECGLGDRQMEIVVTQTKGPAKRSEEKAFRGKMRYVESESRS